MRDSSLLAGLLGTRRQFLQALLWSLVTVASLTIVAGGTYLTRYMTRAAIREPVRVIDCQICDQGRLVIGLTRENDPGTGRSQNKLVAYQRFGGQLADAVAVSPGQPSCFVARRNRPEIFVANADDGSIWWLGGEDGFSRSWLLGRHVQGSAQTLVLASDEATLVSLGHLGIYAWDLNQGQIRWFRGDHEPGAAVILPDCQSLLCCTTRSQSARFEEICLLTGATVQQIQHDAGKITQLVVSPDGRYVAGTVPGSGVLLLERASDGFKWHARHASMGLAGSDIVTPAFSPQSDWLVVGNGGRHGLTVWDLQRACVTEEIRLPETFTVGGSMFLQDSTLLVWSQEGAIYHWRSQDAATGTGPVFESDTEFYSWRQRYRSECARGMAL